MKSLVIAITGSTLGLGCAAATYLSARGHQVLGGGLGLPNTSFTFPYNELLRHGIEVNKAECRKSTDLAVFARKVEAILACRRPRLHYFVGRRDQGLGDELRRFLPWGWTEAIVHRKFGLC